MKSYLLPHSCKWISLAVLASAGLFTYLQSPVGVLAALALSSLGWFGSAERTEDERTARQRLIAVRAAALVSGLFAAVFAVLVAQGASRSPAVFCVLPLAVAAYALVFYGGVWWVRGAGHEE
jgi:hypothetical protein